MKRLPAHVFRLAALTAALIVSAPWRADLHAQPAAPPAVAPKPRLTLTAEQEYIIRENILKDPKVQKESSVPDNIGDIVPDNIILHALPPEVVAKVPLAQAHKYFIEDDSVVLVSPSDRRVADVIKKKPTD